MQLHLKDFRWEIFNQLMIGREQDRSLGAIGYLRGSDLEKDISRGDLEKDISRMVTLKRMQ